MLLQSTNICIELHVPDFTRTINFYTILGFRVVWMSDRYLVMKKGEQSIMSFYGNSEAVYEQSYFRKFNRDTKRGYAVEIIIMDDAIERLYHKIQEQVRIVEPLQLRRWGKRDFRIEDPFGFYLRITEPFNWEEQEKKE